MKPSLLAGFALLLLTACEQGPPVVQPASPGKATVHEDLPVPHGFEFKENQSNTNPTGAFRVVQQALQGKDRKVDFVVGFYEETFPRHGWTLDKKGGDLKNGPAALTFVKRDEKCEIDVRDLSSNTVGIRLNVTRK